MNNASLIAKHLKNIAVTEFCILLRENTMKDNILPPVPKINKTELPYWAEVCGIALSVVSALCIPIVAIKEIVTNWNEGLRKVCEISRIELRNKDK